MAHTAWIKKLTTKLDLKNKGVEIQVNDDDGQFGDIYVAKTGIEWCPGKAHRGKASSTKIKFQELHEICERIDDVRKLLKD